MKLFGLLTLFLRDVRTLAMQTRSLRTRARSLVPAFLVSIVFAPPTLAQFPGDVFFEDPAPSFAEGETVALTVVTFTGTEPLGAASFELVYDRDLFRVDSVQPLGGSGTALAGVDLPSATGTAFSVFNRDALLTPFGTIELARIEGAPLFSGGGTLDFSLAIRRVVDPTGSDFPASQGFNAFVTIVEAGLAAPLAGESAGARVWVPTDELAYPWRYLGRPGMGYLQPSLDPALGPVHVRTYDPGAVSD